MRWGAVFAGAIIGLASFVLLSTLWLALAYASDYEFWSTNLSWWIGGTAVLSMFLGGVLAGLLSGARGAGAGLANGATVWGLLTFTGLFIGIPMSLRYFGTGDSGLAALPGTGLYAGFWSLLVGLGAAAIGGVLGGATPRTVEYAAAEPQGMAGDRYVDVRERTMTRTR